MSRASQLIAIIAMSATPFFLQADDFLRSIPDFTMTDHTGETHSLSEYQDNELLVFYVHGVGCPIARLALPSLREVREEFEQQDIEFLMFNANIQDDAARIQEEVSEFNIDFPVMKDKDQSFAKALGVERTAEVFVVDPETREVLYRGPINDKLGYETQRNNVREPYLKDALNTILAGNTVDMSEIPDSKGCLIGFF